MISLIPIEVPNMGYSLNLCIVFPNNLYYQTLFVVYAVYLKPMKLHISFLRHDDIS